MELTPSDQKVVELLSKLKKSNGAYPSDMLASRRQQYIRQVANAGLGIGIGAGIGKSLHGRNGASVGTTVTSKIVETALIVAIVIEAGTVTYLYRGKIAEWIRSYTISDIQQVVPQPENTSESLVNPVVNENLETLIPTTSETPSGTPSTTIADQYNGTTTNNSGSNDTNTTINATSTPDRGNQYGQTPKPERTKENNSNNSNGGGNSNTDNNNGNGSKDK